MPKILVVDDEMTYRETLAYALKREGFEVETAADGTMALAKFHPEQIDLVILDLMLPGVGGIEVCWQIRAASSVPIIMVTAKDEEVDKVIGLEVAADDYLTKPYSFRELVARIRAVLRRVNTQEVIEEHDVLTVAPLVMDTQAHVVTCRGSELTLPLREFELLEYFMRNPGRALTRTQILDRIWGVDYIGDTKTLDVHVKRIRSKIELTPSSPRLLLTVRGLGYKLVEGE